MKNKKFILLALMVPLACLVALGLYFVPPIHERLAWRVDEISLRVGYALNPPEKQVFVPQQSGPQQGGPQKAGGRPDGELAEPQIIVATMTAAPTPTTAAVAAPTQAATAPPTEAPPPTPTPAPTLPAPPQAAITGVQYEDQHGRWNYCAPATLSMALTFWGWPGNRDVVGPAIKPNEKDKNVMPYEMANYVNEQTGVKAILRVGGDLELLKRLVAAGFPVLVEQGVYFNDISGVVSWMGHYRIVSGYDDAAQMFITQDAFVKANHKVSYEEMIEQWRAFNYTYLVTYPQQREAEMLALLGPDADERANYENAAVKAANEISELNGIDLYFAWFNRGSSLVSLEDYTGAAEAYDKAFAVYPSIAESKRPWRMLWYQTGPYFAYYHTQRYTDLLNLADGTLKAMKGDKNLEESYYWRAMAHAALGETAAAIEDFNLSLEYHPGFPPAWYQLQQLAAGVQTP